MNNMKKKYIEEAAPALMEQYNYKYVMKRPKIDKIAVAVGAGECNDKAKAL